MLRADHLREAREAGEPQIGLELAGDAARHHAAQVLCASAVARVAEVTEVSEALQRP